MITNEHVNSCQYEGQNVSVTFSLLKKLVLMLESSLEVMAKINIDNNILSDKCSSNTNNSYWPVHIFNVCLASNIRYLACYSHIMAW